MHGSPLYKSQPLPSSSFTSFPSVREQVELCRNIASQLVANDNARSKGANMFFKRVKKAHTWEVPPLDLSKGPFEDEDEEKMRQKLAQTLLNSNERSATHNLSLVLDPRGRLHSLSSLKAEGIMVNEHDAVSPIVMSRLIKDLESPEANPRAFELFSKRKQMSQEWEVVSNGNTTNKSSVLTTIEETKINDEEKENKQLFKAAPEPFKPMLAIQPQPMAQPTPVLLRRNSNSRKSSLTANDDSISKRFSLLDPDFFVPAAGSNLSKSQIGLNSSLTKAPLPWGSSALSQSQTPEPFAQPFASKLQLSSSSAASPAFSMIESSSSRIEPVSTFGSKKSSSNLNSSTSNLISSSGMSQSVSSNLNNINTSYNNAINNFNRSYYNTLPSKSTHLSSPVASSPAAANYNPGSGSKTGSSVAQRFNETLSRNNYNKFNNSSNRKSCYNTYNYNQIMGIGEENTSSSNLNSSNSNSNLNNFLNSSNSGSSSLNPYANLPESILF